MAANKKTKAFIIIISVTLVNLWTIILSNLPTNWRHVYFLSM